MNSWLSQDQKFWLQTLDIPPTNKPRNNLILQIDVSIRDVDVTDFAIHRSGVGCGDVHVDGISLAPPLHVLCVLVENLPGVHLILREGLNLQRPACYHGDHLA